MYNIVNKLLDMQNLLDIHVYYLFCLNKYVTFCILSKSGKYPNFVYIYIYIENVFHIQANAIRFDAIKLRFNGDLYTLIFTCNLEDFFRLGSLRHVHWLYR